MPMVIGHEFVGEIVEVGSNVNDFHAGEIVSGEGHVVCGRCRNCLAGRRHLCAHTQGVGVNRPGAFAELIALPMTNVWHHAAGIDRGRGGDLRPVRQRRAHRARVPRAGRGRADHRRRADRHAWRPRSSATPARATSSSPTSTRYRLRAGAADGRHAGRRLRRARRSPTCRRELGMKEGFDVGLEMSGNPAAFRDMLANMCHGGKIAMLGIPSRGDRHRLEHRSSSTCSRSRASTAARCTRPGTR